ncbi:uncharacterized protein LOC129572635 isoform X1 [Sitodiplosis mosellana]|uniref:uncharacterized protein LOC129572635 isoform X1 n=1 Tax=Sitodiplosis mosellana TaxID=263140 RepID=UPI0024450EF8|nr:uncharacterized protein LOC129572635 isoform X1 [Sitodiplosis mosellana]
MNVCNTFQNHSELSSSVKHSSSFYQKLHFLSYLSEILTMFMTIFWLIICSCCLISGEWVQIPQSTRSPHAITLNTSLMMNNAKIHIFDYSKYKDFFSYINPKPDFVKVNKSIVNIHYTNKSDRNDDSASIQIFSEVHPSKIDRENKKNYRNSLQKEGRIVILKPFNFDEIIKFFMDVEHSFSIGTLEGIQYKTKVLKSVQNGILIDIGLLKNECHILQSCDINHFITGRRLKLLLPSAVVQRNENRIRRSPSNHEMDFPSAETALMTISFLTLAVFLIKLVLQVINTIKSKHIGLHAMAPSSVNETPIKIIKTNRNARKLSLPTIITIDNLQSVTEQ